MGPSTEPSGNHASRPDDFVQSVGRALQVLEVVSAEPGLPVKAIARRCGLNLATTYHLVRTLAYRGYLLRDHDGTYTAGREVARRFHDMLASLGRPPEASAVLRHLVDHTGLSAYLGRLNSERVTVVEVVEGPDSPYLEDFETGLDVSAHATALGKALLTTVSVRARRRYLADQGGLQPFTRNTRTDPDELDHQLAAYRPGDVVVEHGEFRDGVACAAVVVPRRTDDAAWSLVVSIRGGDVPAQVRRELVLAAQGLHGAPGRA